MYRPWKLVSNKKVALLIFRGNRDEEQVQSSSSSSYATLRLFSLARSQGLKLKTEVLGKGGKSLY